MTNRVFVPACQAGNLFLGSLRYTDTGSSLASVIEVVLKNAWTARQRKGTEPAFVNVKGALE
jgi:hypothetical protein